MRYFEKRAQSAASAGGSCFHALVVVIVVTNVSLYLTYSFINLGVKPSIQGFGTIHSVRHLRGVSGSAPYLQSRRRGQPGCPNTLCFTPPWRRM